MSSKSILEARSQDGLSGGVWRGNEPAIIVLIFGGPRGKAGKVVGSLAKAGGSGGMTSAVLLLLLLLLVIVLLLLLLLLLGASRGIKAKKRHGLDLGSSR